MGLSFASFCEAQAQARHYDVTVNVLPHSDLDEKAFVDEQLWLQRQGGMSQEQSEVHRRSIEQVAKKKKSGFVFGGKVMVRKKSNRFWLWRPSPVLDLPDTVIFEKFECLENVTVKQMDRAMPRIVDRRPVVAFETIVERAFLLKKSGNGTQNEVEKQSVGPSYRSNVTWKNGVPFKGSLSEISPDGGERIVYEFSKLDSNLWSFQVKRSSYSIETYTEKQEPVPDLSILKLAQNVADERLQIGAPIVYSYQGTIPTLQELKDVSKDEKTGSKDAASPVLIFGGLILSVGGLALFYKGKVPKN